MPVAGVVFKSDGKGGPGVGNIAGILADFLDDAGKVKATWHRLFIKSWLSLTQPAEGGNTTCR